MSVWNPWHGCTRLGNGCKGCVVFRVDAAHVFIKTKRPERFHVGLPEDWGCHSNENVIIGCSCESRYTADRRLPVFLNLPVCHKRIVLEPMLQEINIERYLEKNFCRDRGGHLRWRDRGGREGA